MSNGTYSQFLYNSSLAAHMLSVFKTNTMKLKNDEPQRTMKLKNDEPQRTYAAIATLYKPKLPW